MKGTKQRMKGLIRSALVVVGLIAATMIILAFTTAPFRTWYNLSLKKAGIHRPPDYIVVLGGGGMPSESGLIRCWYAAGVADCFSRSKIIIALPGDTTSEKSSVSLMKKEVVLRGINPGRIFYEPEGANTRAQAINIYKRITNYELRIMNTGRNRPSSLVPRPSSLVPRPSSLSSILIVTSPEHLYRAVLVFKKAGFQRVDGLPAFERAIESDILFDGRNLGGRKFIPDIGGFITLRYGFWTQMNYEILLLREYFALAYYTLKGWI